MKGMIWVFPVAEWGVVALFAWCARDAWTAWRTRSKGSGESGDGERGDGGREMGVLFSAALYAWLFENLNVRRGGGRGAYHYNEHFSLFIDQVPLFIMLAWAVILWTAMRLTDAASSAIARHEYSCGGMISNRAAWRDGVRRVASDAALAVFLDISFDATAIRYGFWFWHGVEFDQAWFGVPAGNFFGWLLVSLCFSGLTRALSSLFTPHVVQRRIAAPGFSAHGFATRVLRLENFTACAKAAHFLMQITLVPIVAFALYRSLESAVNFFLLRVGATSDRASLLAFFAVFCIIVLAARAPRFKIYRLPDEIAGDSNHEIKVDNATGANATGANATGANAANASSTSTRGGISRAWDFARRLMHGDIVFWVRSSFHAFAVVGLLMLPSTPLLATQRPALLGIAGLVCVLDGLSGWWLGRVNRQA